MTPRQAPQIVRILPVLNEADVLHQNLRWYAEASIETVAVDGGSVDGTQEILRDAQREGLVLETEILEGEDSSWPKISSTLLEMASARRADLILLAGADEFVESPDERPLREALEGDFAAGATRMRLDVMEFCLSDADEPEHSDLLERMRHYCHHSAADAFRIFRQDASLDLSNPRAIRSAERQVTAKRSYILRHYPLRSEAHAALKLATGRLKPYLTGSVVHEFARVARDGHDFVLPAKDLTKREGGPWLRRDRATRAYLRRASKEVVSFRVKHRRLEREFAQLRLKYGRVLLERERDSRPEGSVGASAEWYDEMYRFNREAYEVEATASVYHPAWKRILERVGREARVLEIGCGSGQLAQMLLERGVRDYVGFDFSSTAIDMAKSRIPGGRFLVDDARTTSLFHDLDYDLIVCTEVLEHLDDDLGLLRRIGHGVRVVATVPSFDSTSHLRYFSDSRLVLNRYSDVLSSLALDSVVLEGGGVLHLLDGFANDRPDGE